MRYKASLGYQGGSMKSYPEQTINGRHFPAETEEEFLARCKRIAILCNPEDIKIEPCE